MVNLNVVCTKEANLTDIGSPQHARWLNGGRGTLPSRERLALANRPKAASLIALHLLLVQLLVQVRVHCSAFNEWRAQ